MPIALPQETMTIMNAPIGDSHKKDIAHALHPYTNLAVHEDQGPLIISKGEGVYVWDDQGNRYLEGLGGLWCVSLGFSEPRLAAAAADPDSDGSTCLGARGIDAC